METTKNIQLIKQSLSEAGIYHGELSESKLIENYAYYVKIGKIKTN